MTSEANDPKIVQFSRLPPPILTAEEHAKIVVAAEPALREVAAECKINLEGIDLVPCFNWMAHMALRYENIKASIDKLPTVDSALKYALNHEAQHAVTLIEVRAKFPTFQEHKAVTPAPTATPPAPKASTFHMNLVLAAEWDQQLSEVGFKCRSLGGHKFSKTEVLRPLIRFLLEDLQPRLDLNNVKTEDELLDRLRQAAKKP